MATIHRFSLLLLALALAAPATAQLSRARSYLDTVRSQGEALDGLVNRTPLDEPRIYAAARQLRDASRSAADAVASFGEQLANSASHPFEDQLRAPSKMAKTMAYELHDRGTLVEKCDALMKLINTTGSSRPNDFASQANQLMTELIVKARARTKDLEELVKKSDETIRWLRESLQATRAMNENSGRPFQALAAAKEQLETKSREQYAELNRLFDELRRANERSTNAAHKFRDAAKEHEAARLAAPGSSYTSNATNAYRKLLAAEGEQKDAEKARYECLVQLERGTTEAKNRLGELARIMSDVDRFLDTANPETIGKRLTDFDNWTRLFEAELGR